MLECTVLAPLQAYRASSLHTILNARSLLRLSASVMPLAVQSGHDVCQQGDDADCFWFLTEGMHALYPRWPHPADCRNRRSVPRSSCEAA